jgi:hypothetical protein
MNKTSAHRSSVIPAKAGIQHVLSSQNGGQSKNGGALRREGTLLDSGFRRNDEGFFTRLLYSIVPLIAVPRLRSSNFWRFYYPAKP